MGILSQGDFVQLENNRVIPFQVHSQVGHENLVCVFVLRQVNHFVHICASLPGDVLVGESKFLFVLKIIFDAVLVVFLAGISLRVALVNLENIDVLICLIFVIGILVSEDNHIVTVSIHGSVLIAGEVKSSLQSNELLVRKESKRFQFVFFSGPLVFIIPLLLLDEEARFVVRPESHEGVGNRFISFHFVFCVHDISFLI